MRQKLIVTAKLGDLEYKSEADPYNPNAREEQYNSCLEDIYKQMKETGRYEMRNAFNFSDKIETKPE